MAPVMSQGSAYREGDAEYQRISARIKELSRKIGEKEESIGEAKDQAAVMESQSSTAPRRIGRLNVVAPPALAEDLFEPALLLLESPSLPSASSC